MKKVLPFIICVLLLGVSCTQQSTELTDEQKASIISEVGEQVDRYQSAGVQLNFEEWTGYWSADDFVSVSSNIDFFNSQSVWLDFVKNSWSGVESRSTESFEKRITPLTLNLALVTRTAHGLTVLKNEGKLTFTFQASSIWIKEAVGWKIIQLHESFQTTPVEE